MSHFRSKRASARRIRRALEARGRGAAILVAALALIPPAARAWNFTDVTSAAGLGVPHVMDNTSTPQRIMAGGAAAGDYDGDGWIDLYFLGGNAARNRLFRNNGDGTFTDVATTAGVDLPGCLGTGATFADWTGDGRLDLFVGGAETTTLKMFRNEGDGTFTDVTAASGVDILTDTFSATFGDIDRDGDLDLLTAHWGTVPGPGHIWKNDGDGTFTESDVAVGYVGWDSAGTDWSFTFNAADLNGDGWPDLVITSDYGTSQVFLNDGDGTFTNATDPAVIIDDNGMGSTVADYDRDGDLDWFVTSIFYGTRVGNRLYRNDGGTFVDATPGAGVANGQFGWGASFQDFDNDGWLDIYHVNGWTTTGFQTDPARMFHSDGDGTFTEAAAPLGVADTGQGRGVCCFDYDRDGDIDLFIANNSGPCVLYRNDGGNDLDWLDVKLVGSSPNTEAIGATIRVTVGSTTQMWEMRCGNNFDSQDPAEAHFGLGTAASVDEVRVDWPDGSVTSLTDVPSRTRLVVTQGSAVTASPPRWSEAAPGIVAAPNPFRTSTTFGLSLPAPDAEATTLRIIDASGRTVRRLTTDRPSPGATGIVWDGRDESGRAVASGVYWVELRAGGPPAWGRVVRLR